MFRIAIFSDVHGNQEALEAILASIEKSEFDEVICLGDVIGLGPNPKECLDLIRQNHIKMVLGNHERYYLNGTHNEKEMSEEEKRHHAWVASKLTIEDKEYLRKLDICLEVALNDQKLCFMHYPFAQVENDFYPPKHLTEEHVKRVFRNYNADFTFIGHFHQEDFYKSENERVYVNLGSVGCTKNNITNYTIFEFDGENFSIYRKKCFYDRIQFETKLNSISYPDKEEIRKIFFE